MPQPLIVGIDIGLKNLSICGLDPSDLSSPKIWSLLDVRGVTPAEVIKNIIEELDSLDLINRFDINNVLVELQMHKAMTGVSYAVMTYFLIYRVNAQLVGANAKRKYLPKHSNYVDRKQSSIIAVKNRLSDEAKDTLCKFKKQDDLCDSYLYALHGCGKILTTKK